MSKLLILLVLISIASSVHVIGMTIGCSITGVRLSIICFGWGPLLTSIQTRIGRIELRLFPGSCYIKPQEGELEHQSRRIRIYLELAGPVALLATAAMILPVSGAWQHFSSTFGNFYAFARSPRAEGCLLWEHYFEIQRSNPLGSYGIIAAKFAALNLLPLPPLNGGKVLLNLLGMNVGKDTKTVEYITTIGALMFFYPIFRILQSLWFYLRQ